MANDNNASIACKKAIKLCDYMLRTSEDKFVRQEKSKIRLLLFDNQIERSAQEAKLVSRYIRDNFDNVMGENILVDIEHLLNERPPESSV